MFSTRVETRKLSLVELKPNTESDLVLIINLDASIELAHRNKQNITLTSHEMSAVSRLITEYLSNHPLREKEENK